MDVSIVEVLAFLCKSTIGHAQVFSDLGKSQISLLVESEFSLGYVLILDHGFRFVLDHI